MPETKTKTTSKKDDAASTEKKAKIPKPKPLVKGDDHYAIYDSTATRDSYKVGDVIKFEKVREWLNKGELVPAYGKVVGISIFDKTIPYLEVSFSDVKKLNTVDLGSDIRKFILEQK
jgi:hypothetical protein